jgi:hypothetical protein
LISDDNASAQSADAYQKTARMSSHGAAQAIHEELTEQHNGMSDVGMSDVGLVLTIRASLARVARFFPVSAHGDLEE